jgi:hypothetical protein
MGGLSGTIVPFRFLRRADCEFGLWLLFSS